MRFGLFYEHQLPRPWEPDDERQLLSDALEQVELADVLGFDYLWEVEHHFLEEYSHSSAPEVFLAAASQRTRRIRLGHGIVALPPAYNHPARVAERIATLDLVSGGRVDLGTGETSTTMELDGFGVPRDTKREQWSEALDVLTRMLVETPFGGHDGTYLQVPVRNVVPKPLQKPHPPLWVACTRRETIHLAAERGIGALTFSFVEPDEARAFVDDYYATIASEACVPAGFALNPNVATVLPLMCDRVEERAIERGLDGAHFFAYSLGHYYVYGSHRPGLTDVWTEFHQRRAQYGFDRDVAAQVAQLGVRSAPDGFGPTRGAIGTPAQIRSLLRAYADAGVDQVIFISQAGRTRHEHICESLELFAAEVMGDLAEGEDERQARKAERLAAATEAALRRRPPRREAPPTTVPAKPR